MVLVGVAGAAIVIFTSPQTPTLTIRGPEMPWFVSGKACDYPSYERVLWDYDWGGGKPGLALCFLALNNGQIPYAVAPTPPEEQARLARQEAEDRARTARGEPPVIRLTSPWFYSANEYDDRVQEYVGNTVASLRVTPELRQNLKDSRWSDRWRAHKKALDDTAPWIFGLLAFIWVLTAVIGWIVRGFAGVPNGQDFKPEARQ
jgi:hypothetical protein